MITTQLRNSDLLTPGHRRVRKHEDWLLLANEVEFRITLYWGLLQKRRRTGDYVMARALKMQLMEYLGLRAIGQGRIPTWS